MWMVVESGHKNVFYIDTSPSLAAPMDRGRYWVGKEIKETTFNSCSHLPLNRGGNLNLIKSWYFFNYTHHF